MAKKDTGVPQWIVKILDELNVEDFITFIETETAIWDSASEAYSNNLETEKAWKNVCLKFDPDFDSRPQKEKNMLGLLTRGKKPGEEAAGFGNVIELVGRNLGKGEVILGGFEMSFVPKSAIGKSLHRRWRSLRDCYTRELRKKKTQKSGAAASVRKPYIYFELLRFLEPTCCITESNIEEELDDEKEQELAEQATEQETVQNSDPQYPQPSRSKKKKNEEDLLLEVLKKKFISKNTTPPSKPTEDADSMFLLSLLPELKKFPEDQKLYVKSQVLNTILHLQSNIRPSSNPGPSLPPYNVTSFQPHIPNQYYPPQPGPYQSFQPPVQNNYANPASVPGPSSQATTHHQLTPLAVQTSPRQLISPGESSTQSSLESDAFNFWNQPE